MRLLLAFLLSFLQSRRSVPRITPAAINLNFWIEYLCLLLYPFLHRSGWNLAHESKTCGTFSHMQNVTTVGNSWRCQVVVTARLDNQDDDLTSPKPYVLSASESRTRFPQYLDGGHYHYQASDSGPRWTTSVNLLCPPTMETHRRLRSELPVSNASTEPHSGVRHSGH